MAAELGDLYSGLRELAESAFPKRCRNCGRTYATAAEFITATHAISEKRSGLKPALDDDGRVILELFRNCVCGSTLMDTFNDRRDVSESGRKRRERFSVIHAQLVKLGIAAETATAELRNVARGQASALLSELTVRQHTRK